MQSAEPMTSPFSKCVIFMIGRNRGLTRKMHTPAMMAPCMHETPALSGTKFRKPYPYRHKVGPNSIPLLAQIHKKGTLCGNKGSELACWHNFEEVFLFSSHK